MKYLSQASGYRMVHLCLFPNPSRNKKKKKGESSFFFLSGKNKKKVYLHIIWISSGITAMFRTRLLNKYILRCK